MAPVVPAPPARAQTVGDPAPLSTPTSHLRFTHLTTEDGLSHNAITAVMQDRQGFIWIGTKDGLNRFDGYQMTTYRHDPNDPASLSHNEIAAIVEDVNGALWITTHGGGLNRFDPTSGTFTRYQTGIGKRLFAVAYDQAGNLWVGAPPPVGLYGLAADQVAALAVDTAYTATFQSQSLDVLVTPSAPFNATDGIREGAFRGGVQAIVEDAAGRFWMAADLALVRFDPDAGDPEAALVAYDPGPEEGRLNAIALDAAGDPWVGGPTGLYHFNPATETFTHYKIDFEIDALYFDDGTLWIGGAALYAFDPRAGRVVQRISPRDEQSTGLNNGIVTVIYRDAGGVVWIGTTEGLDRFDPRQQQFDTYSYDAEQRAGLSDNQVQAITGDDTGAIWLATPRVLDRLDPTTGIVTHYTPGQDTPANAGLGLSALLSDREGDIWIGASARVYRLTPNTGALENYDIVPEDLSPGPPPNVTAIVEDAKGDVWIAMTLVGLHHYDRQTQTFHTYLTEAPGVTYNPATIASNRTSALHIGPSGTLWIGSRDGVLSCFDSASTIFTHYLPDWPGEASSFGWIEDIYEDSAGTVWLATRDGLMRVEPPAGSEQVVVLAPTRRYSDKDGLPASYVVSILAEQAGATGERYLWLGTTSGLTRFDPGADIFRTFSVADGLPSNTFLPRAAWQAPNGRIYLGSTQGVTAFDPNRITFSDYEPPVIVTELRLANMAVAVGQDTRLQRPIWDTDHLTLRHDDDIVSFVFAALDYAAPRKLHYRYRLEGLEKAWVPVSSEQRLATYTHLPAGDYTFRVQGTNASDLWSSNEATLAITVLPPWWETWWFRGGVALTITALVGAVVHWRIRDIRRRNVELQTQVAEQTAQLAEEKAHVETAHAALHTVLNNLDALIYVADLKTHEILFANAQIQEIFGDVEGLTCWQALQDDQTGPCVFCSPEVAGARGTADTIQRWQFQNTHNGRWYAVASSVVTWIDGRRVRLSMAADITDHKEAEQRLVAQERLVAALDERERIGRDLHDDLGQVMGYVNAQTQAALALLQEEHYDQVQATLHQLAGAAQEAHADVRRYILGVRSSSAPTAAVATTPDFLTALERYLQQLHDRAGLTVHVNWPESLRESPLAPDVETQLLRIIQEALTNVRKHAGVDTARLIFTVHPEILQVIVSDEGRGFDAANADSHTQFGLTIMRERAEKVGGRLQVVSQPGAGTQVMVHLPRTLASRTGEELRGLRVLLVDDHDLYLKGLRNLLSAHGVHVIGVAHDGLEAQDLARQHRPDLILMDVEMPRCDGIEATRQIKAAMPETRIVMLTVAADDATLFEALKSGADGYLLKDLESQQFFNLLRDVLQGDNVLSPGLAARTLKTLLKGESPDEEDPIPSLTPRQREVLELVAQGMTNREIAQALYISPDTVKYHVSQILDRLHVQSRYELADYAPSPDELA